MKNNRIRIEVIIVCILWLTVTGFAWFSPAKDISISERRPLKQFPDVTLENVLKGKFMTDFESYTLDQFPLRDRIRTLKALTAYNLFLQKDNNDIYVTQGQAASLDFPMNQASVDRAKDKISALYEKYIKDTSSNVYFSIVPDKGYFLAENGGYPVMDYAKLEKELTENLSFAQYIRIFDTLDGTDYYATDSHWKQEELTQTVKTLADGMNISDLLYTEHETVTADVPFYGVYYGQAALPLKPDTIRYLTNEQIEACTVFNLEKNAYGKVYDLEKLNSRDPYEVFLSGASALLTVTNPNANSDRELVLFRDSYGSSITPLLLGAYAKVTIVDTRYVYPDFLANYVDFANADDVLFLYSTTLLNNSGTLR